MIVKVYMVDGIFVFGMIELKSKKLEVYVNFEVCVEKLKSWLNEFLGDLVLEFILVC